MTRSNRLGRGLGAIFSDKGDIQIQRYISVDDILPNPYQPRKIIPEEELRDLAESIKLHGLLQPIVVRERGDRYEIVVGERRWRAAKLAGLSKIPAIVKNVESDEEMLVFALVENLQREDLNPVEKALAIKRLKDEFKVTDAEIAQVMGKSRSAVTNTMRLLSLPEEVLEMVARGDLSEGHARVLLRLKSPKEILIWAKRVVDEGLSVRDLERLLSPIRKENWVEEYEERMNRVGLKGKIRTGKRSFTLELKFKNREELDEFLSKVV